MRLIVLKEADLLSDWVDAACQTLRGDGIAEAAEQMRTAADSIANNIAEGYGRGVNPDCNRFFRMARGSCDELETQLRANMRRGRLEKAVCERLIMQTRKVRLQIERFMASVDRRYNARLKAEAESRQTRRKRTNPDRKRSP